MSNASSNLKIKHNKQINNLFANYPVFKQYVPRATYEAERMFYALPILKNPGFEAFHKDLYSVLLRFLRRSNRITASIPCYAGIKRQTTVMRRTRTCPTLPWPLHWTCLTTTPLTEQSTPVINKTLEKGFRWLPSIMSSGWISAQAVLLSSQSCSPTRVT